MHSSILPSDTLKYEVGGTHDGALARGLRKTASDRPGQAQPVPTRDIPRQPWLRIALSVLVTVAVLMIAWETQMRRIGLRAGDLDDSPQAWAEQRRLADLAPVTIVGDSRILFDTDLDRFEQLTGVRPVQTSIIGTNARALLENYANDANFHGLLILGMAELSYFRPEGVGIGGPYLKNFDKSDKPSQLSGLRLDHALQRELAFMDSDYRLSLLAARFDHGLRPGARSPYDVPWKLSEVSDGRQYFMWDRIETDPRLRAHARYAWNLFKGPPLPPVLIRNVIARTAEAVRRIRARGGEVIFVRPPSAPELRMVENQRLPRRKGWDPLLAAAKAKGIHSDDLPQAQNLTLPEWSHLNRRCATVYTDAYVRKLVQLTSRVRLQPGAPRPLSRADCVQSRGIGLPQAANERPLDIASAS